ncbi:N-6 DNA methylase [Nannocystis sp.]|uniref:HsdM family class I SAM-dependent methyltransferase n=1 Tax=Nannocystis sp. TaxID=1962667 RepID=UPI0025F2688E|nr:N-6 DNA methylase [Nannocystis sp.]MBK7823787.1 N-6 DNA methylase [Nannocystis sp.]
MTRPAGAALLADLEKQRDALARSLRGANPRLDALALTELTTHLLDRMIFLRLLADAQIEPDALTGIAASNSPWATFQAACRRLDRLHEHPVAPPRLDRLRVDEAMFAAVCHHLAPRGSADPLPPGILGDLHERSLGQVLAVRGGDAHFVARPGPRRSAGAYYTPAYIVGLIIEQTLGPHIVGKTPAELAELRVCDLACGGGAFLLGVYERLLAAHAQWYQQHPAEASRAGCVRQRDGSLALSLPQRQAILVANIFGVDIDPQAVAIARRTLSLKLLAGHTPTAPVPTLGRNIVCADALRRDDRPTVEQLFPAVMRSGGFDVIVGNPPYVRPHNLSAAHKRRLWDHYPVFKAKADLYACFMQRSTALLKPGGYLGYIVARGWLALDSFDVLRRHILEHYKIQQLIELPARVFAEAQVETIALVFQRALEAKARDRNVIAVNTLVGERVQPQRTIRQQAFAATYCNVFDLSIEPATEAVKSRMREGPSARLPL